MSKSASQRPSGLASTSGAVLTLLAASAVLGCSGQPHELTIESSAQALREARTVLGLEAADAWRAEGASLRSSLVHAQGEAALQLEVPDSESAALISAPFEFRKTPNSFVFYVRAADGASEQLDVTAQFNCENNGQAARHERVGSVSLRGLTKGSFSRAELAVPSALQAALAGGCDRLALELDVRAPTQGGSYLVDGIELRAATPAVEVLAQPLCGLPDDEALARNAVEGADGLMDYEAWSAEPAVQAELIELEAALEPFGDRALEPVLDHQRQQLVVPVDQAAAGDVQAALEAAQIALPLRVQTACHPVAELRAAQATVMQRNWHPRAMSIALGAYPDSLRAQLVVTFERGGVANDQADELGAEAVDALGARATDSARVEAEPSALAREVAGALADRLGELVQIQWGHPARHTRARDVQPHFGAAGIGSGGANFCTSGFIVVRNGLKSSVTAGHCYSNGNAVFSGNTRYGTAAGLAPFPQFDMIRIEAGAQVFGRGIWTDPGAPATRLQTHRINAALQSRVCTSGERSLAICNILVTTNLAMLCDRNNACTPNLTRGSRGGVILSRPGDSGAVMYSADGANGATIHGMAIGSIDGMADVGWHKVTDVEARLGVVVALQ